MVNLINTIKEIIVKLKNYLKTNILMCSFIITSIINEVLVRYYTVQNTFSIKPILADLALLLFITAFGS